MADPHGSGINNQLQIYRMITQLQTQLSVISMHCGEISKLCVDRADPRKVEQKCRVLRDEEKEVVKVLKELLALKTGLKYVDQQQLDVRLRPLSDEYGKSVKRYQRVWMQGQAYCAQMRSMTASQLRAAREETSPGHLDLGEGLGRAVLLEEVPADDAMQELTLEQDMSQLSEMFDLLLAQTEDQGRRIDTLEAHMEAAEAEARAAAVSLTTAAKFSAATVPIAGALLGGALLGPLGMLAGLKGASALTAAVGVGAGYLTGAWYKRRVNASADAAREELEAKDK